MECRPDLPAECPRCYINLSPDRFCELCSPQLFLSRIVDCARVFKLSSAADLFRETRWIGSDKYGNAILQLVQQYFPLPQEEPPRVALSPVQRRSAPIICFHRMDSVDSIRQQLNLPQLHGSQILHPHALKYLVYHLY